MQEGSVFDCVFLSVQAKTIEHFDKESPIFGTRAVFNCIQVKFEYHGQ